MDTTLKLKQSLVESINAITDVKLLETIESLIKLENVYELSDEQLARVEESREQIKQGKYVENQEALNRLNKWLENQ